MSGSRKLELEKACAIHSNVRTEYFFAHMLHQEALKTAQSFERRANDAFVKLQDVSARVTACMDIALSDVDSDEKSSGSESDSENSENSSMYQAKSPSYQRN
jgi:hypothetical protein